MEYQEFDVQAFAADPRFIRWVRQPDDESRLFWEEWLDRHPDKRATVEEARQLVVFLSFDPVRPDRSDMEEVRKAIKTQIREPQPGAGESAGEPLGYPFFARRWFRVAAALAAVCVFAALYAWLSPTDARIVYQTGYGETKTLILPDQSIVTLNAHTTLEVDRAWRADRPREVWINGEAFFRVRKRLDPATGAPTLPDSKFTVHTKGLDVQVVGTEFNVLDRAGRVQVVLTSGRVKLNLPAQTRSEVWMKPGDLVEFSKKTQKVSQRPVDTNHYTAWLQHKLMFDESPMPEVIRAIEEQYGVRIVCDDPALRALRFTGSVPGNNLAVVLKILRESFQIDIVRKSNQIHMQKKP